MVLRTRIENARRGDVLMLQAGDRRLEAKIDRLVYSEASPEIVVYFSPGEELNRLTFRHGSIVHLQVDTQEFISGKRDSLESGGN